MLSSARHIAAHRTENTAARLFAREADADAEAAAARFPTALTTAVGRTGGDGKAGAAAEARSASLPVRRNTNTAADGPFHPANGAAPDADAEVTAADDTPSDRAVGDRRNPVATSSSIDAGASAVPDGVKRAAANGDKTAAPAPPNQSGDHLQLQAVWSIVEQATSAPFAPQATFASGRSAGAASAAAGADADDAGASGSTATAAEAGTDATGIAADASSDGLPAAAAAGDDGFARAGALSGAAMSGASSSLQSDAEAAAAPALSTFGREAHVVAGDGGSAPVLPAHLLASSSVIAAADASSANNAATGGDSGQTGTQAWAGAAPSAAAVAATGEPAASFGEMTGTAGAPAADPLGQGAAGSAASDPASRISAMLVASLRGDGGIGGDQDVSLRLRSPGLGDVNVRVVVSGQDVSAWFDAAQAQAQQVLGQGMGQLHTDLAAAGYNLTGAWVGGEAWTPQGSAGETPTSPALRQTPVVAAIDRMPAFASPAADVGVSIYV